MVSAPALQPVIRTGFARTDDGYNLYWRAVGSGPPIVCCNGVGVSTFFWKYLVQYFSTRYTVLLWDYLGHGRSDVPTELDRVEFSIRRHAFDLSRVMDAAGIPRALMVGHSMGCQVIFEFNRLFPDRVMGLVPVLGSAGKTLETFMDYSGSPKYFKIVGRLIEQAGPVAQLIVRPILMSPLSWTVAKAARMVDPVYCAEDDMRPYMRHIANMNLRIFFRNVLQTNEHDAWDTLPHIQVPVLVVAAEHDAFTPVWLSKRMARVIPNADYIELADGSHAALVEQPETLLHRMERFIQDRAVFKV